MDIGLWRYVKVSFTCNGYYEEVWYDVLLMDFCHLCLGVDWFQRQKNSNEKKSSKYVMDQWENHLFLSTINGDHDPDLKGVTLFMKASTEKYEAWEPMMDKLFGSYYYLDESKFKIAFGPLNNDFPIIGRIIPT